MAHINNRPCTLRGCAVCSRRAVAEAVAMFVKIGALPLREARRALRSCLSEEERTARIRALRAELAELEGEAEAERRTGEDEDERRTSEPTYTYSIPARGDERMTDETEGLLKSNIHDWNEPATMGSNVSARKPETNDLRGRDIGQRRNASQFDTTGNVDQRLGGAREAIAIFKRAGIRVRG